MSTLPEKSRNGAARPASFPDEPMAAGDNMENIARMAEPAFGYVSNWTSMLPDAPAIDPESMKKVDIAATKIAARELCQTLSPTLCHCPGDPLKCHALKVYMQPALKIVAALRKSDVLR